MALPSKCVHNVQYGKKKSLQFDTKIMDDFLLNQIAVYTLVSTCNFTHPKLQNIQTGIYSSPPTMHGLAEIEATAEFPKTKKNQRKRKQKSQIPISNN